LFSARSPVAGGGAKYKGAVPIYQYGRTGS
jgi:hypothetical protein